MAAVAVAVAGLWGQQAGCVADCDQSRIIRLAKSAVESMNCDLPRRCSWEVVLEVRIGLARCLLYLDLHQK